MNRRRYGECEAWIIVRQQFVCSSQHERPTNAGGYSADDLGEHRTANVEKMRTPVVRIVVNHQQREVAAKWVWALQFTVCLPNRQWQTPAQRWNKNSLLFSTVQASSRSECSLTS